MNIFKHWKARIVTGKNASEMLATETAYVHGDTLLQLRSAARVHLMKKRPSYFTNGGDHIAGIYRYFYYDKIETSSAILRPESSEEGWWWYRQDLVMGSSIPAETQGKPERLENFNAAIEHFLRYAIIPEKGVAYQSAAIVEKNLQLPLLEKILREDDDRPINDLIQRGWHIIALEYNGEASITGELLNRKAVFVMGHPEEQAASCTTDSAYYRNAIYRLREKIVGNE